MAPTHAARSIQTLAPARQLASCNNDFTVERKHAHSPEHRHRRLPMALIIPEWLSCFECHAVSYRPTLPETSRARHKCIDRCRPPRRTPSPQTPNIEGSNMKPLMVSVRNENPWFDPLTVHNGTACFWGMLACYSSIAASQLVVGTRLVILIEARSHRMQCAKRLVIMGFEWHNMLQHRVPQRRRPSCVCVTFLERCVAHLYVCTLEYTYISVA